MWSGFSALEEKVFELQAQIYDLHNQNCEYELRFKRMSAAASYRIMETEETRVDGRPMPWKLVAEADKSSPSGDQAWIFLG